jgi:hypothetical protein
MAASDRRIGLELTGMMICQCQLHGSLPILWHWENCESSCVRTKSKSKERAEYTPINFAGAASHGSRCLQVSEAMRIRRHPAQEMPDLYVCASGLTEKEAKEIAGSAG